MIKDIGGRISMSPPLEMAMAHGMPSVQDALDRGIRPSLSSDHGTTVGQDCFSMMRTTFNLQRLRILQRRRNGEKDTPPLVTCRDVLDFATLQGARCANIDGKVGTLTPGKEADILMLRADRIDIWPLNNAPSVVANFMNPGHVENVLHRREAEEVARQSGGRRRGARPAAGAGGPRRADAANEPPDGFARLNLGMEIARTVAGAAIWLRRARVPALVFPALVFLALQDRDSNT